jgi:hypothetical protein
MAMEIMVMQMTVALIQRARDLSLFRTWAGRGLGLRAWMVIGLMVWGMQPRTPAEPVLVRHLQGSVHGFLVQRAEDGHIVATGDSVQVSHGDQVTLRTIFTYKDGSVDDETTVFSQRRSFRLISDHHVQKGPFFPHPMDLTIDTRSGLVTTRSVGKGGKEEVHAVHMTLPEDLANGIVSQVIGSVKADSSTTTVSMLVTAPKPRIVKLAISSVGEDSFSIGGAAHKAIHYEIKIVIGGVAGAVAPLVGKAPPNIELWEVGGEAPTFLREQGPTFDDGPKLTIELVGPEWSGAPKANT